MNVTPSPVPPVAVPNVYKYIEVYDWLNAIGDTEGADALKVMMEDEWFMGEAALLDLKSPKLHPLLVKGLMMLTGGEYGIVIWVDQ